MTTKRKRIPQHLEYAVEDLTEWTAEISRLRKSMYKALTSPRGVNKYLLMAKVSDIAVAVANLEKTLARIERREGPPTNNSTRPEISKSWVDMFAELVEDETLDKAGFTHTSFSYETDL